MNPLVVLSTTALGALIGTAAGLLILYRRLRPPITEAQLAELKGKLRTGESSLAAATANLEDLRKQLTFQEKSLVQNAEDLKKKQEQLEIEAEEKQKERARRTAAEHSVQELSTKVVVLAEDTKKAEARALEADRILGEKATRLTAVEADLEAEKRKAHELAEQAARAAVEAADSRRFAEQEARLRASLESQLSADQERIRQLTADVGELRNERSQLEVKLQEERGSAAKGMELLLAAQQKLSSVFKALGADNENGNHVQPPVEAALRIPQTKQEADELVRSLSAK
ncbi:MAG TPA: hypothetical protein VMH81_22190 [Bryobacteraceae bacterium]|nr:hypothetical protein [Bryobacteraceae bacterium]